MWIGSLFIVAGGCETSGFICVVGLEFDGFDLCIAEVGGYEGGPFGAIRV